VRVWWGHLGRDVATNALPLVITLPQFLPSGRNNVATFDILPDKQTNRLTTNWMTTLTTLTQICP